MRALPGGLLGRQCCVEERGRSIRPRQPASGSGPSRAGPLHCKVCVAHPDNCGEACNRACPLRRRRPQPRAASRRWTGRCCRWRPSGACSWRGCRAPPRSTPCGASPSPRSPRRRSRATCPPGGARPAPPCSAPCYLVLQHVLLGSWPPGAARSQLSKASASRAVACPQATNSPRFLSWVSVCAETMQRNSCGCLAADASVLTCVAQRSI